LADGTQRELDAALTGGASLVAATERSSASIDGDVVIRRS